METIDVQVIKIINVEYLFTHCYKYTAISKEQCMLKPREILILIESQGGVDAVHIINTCPFVLLIRTSCQFKTIAKAESCKK